MPWLPLLVSFLSSGTVQREQAAPAFNVVAYHVVIRPDALSKSIAGQTRIVVQRLGPGDAEISFRLNRLVVSEVLLDGKLQAIRIEDDRLKVAIPAELRANPSTLAVT